MMLSYNNKSKNRFAYFDSYPYDISLVEYKKKFNSIKFKDQFLSQNISEPLNVIKEQTPKLSYGSAKSQILNSLEYRLGYSMIENSKSILGILKLPFVLIDIVIIYQKEQNI